MEIILKGRAWTYGDEINTDYIFPMRYFGAGMSAPQELAKVAMENIDPGFAARVQKGDFVVGGRNFGCGSSREGAAAALKYAGGGLSGILAESFARIFYRNCINIGFPALVASGVTEQVGNGDVIEVNIATGEVRNETRGTQFAVEPTPEQSLHILKEGGLIKYMRNAGKL